MRRTVSDRAWVLRRGIPCFAVVIAAALVVVVAAANPGRTPVVSSPSAAAGPPSPPPTSPSPQPASPSPQPTPPPRAGSWIELRWSAPTPIPGILDVVSWHDGFVAGADVPGPDALVGAAYASVDGMRWERTATFPARPRIFATVTGLVAVVNRAGPSPSVEAWTSIDGRSWQPQQRLALAGAAIGSLAARGTTIVAAGTDADGRPMLWSSTAGAPWTVGQQPAPHAIVRGVTAISDGFVALGRDGDPDTGSGGISAPGVGRPASWTSADGRAWSAAQVEGVPAAGAQLTGVFQVADGFFAIGSDATAPGQNARSPLIWVSADARDWRIVGPPEHWGRASANGRQAVVFSYADFGTTALGAWSSLDGRVWTPLSFSGDVADIPAFTAGLGQNSGVDGILVVSRGVVVIGQQNGQPTAWFAEASGP
jgi:hypothetical protein